MKFNRALTMTKEVLPEKDELLETTPLLPSSKRSSRLLSGSSTDSKCKVSLKAPAAKKIVAKSLSTLLKGRAKLRRKDIEKTKSAKSEILSSSATSSPRESSRLLKISISEDESKINSKVSALKILNSGEESLKVENEMYVFKIF